MERHIPGGGGKLSVIVPAAVALMGLIALIVSRVGQLLGLLLQQLVQRMKAEHRYIPPMNSCTREKFDQKVAIIGAGPAGMSCA